MMQKSTRISGKLLYSIFTVLLLLAVLITMIWTVFSNVEEDGFKTLHLRTEQIKEDIELQMNSDHENLVTMARFAASLYSRGESYDHLFESFEPIGLIESIGILQPDGVLLSAIGSVDLSSEISFSEEVQKGAYISGRIDDLTAPREIIRSAAPIIVDDQIVGILYGVTNLKSLEARYEDRVAALEAQLYVLESESGQLIIDTYHGTLENISNLDTRTYNKGYSYKEMRKDISAGIPGFSAFISEVTNRTLYVHYAPLEIEGWTIMLGRTEADVFASARHTAGLLLLSTGLIIFIMAAYLLFVFLGEKSRSDLVSRASQIRKQLLDLNHQQYSIKDSLKSLVRYSRARSAFFVDMDGEDYNYIIPNLEKRLLQDSDRVHFISELLNYASEWHGNHTSAVNILKIKRTKSLLKHYPKFYDFLKQQHMDCVVYAVIANRDNHISLLGIINPKQENAAQKILSDISVCFSIAVFNKKHLNRTEMAATTDALTGLLNRVVYNRDLERFDAAMPQQFSCIFLDVNELHLFNNRFGHSAGDSMLIYIANTIKEIFYGQNIYRMGGDEFLIFAENMDEETLQENIRKLTRAVEEMNYHISAGVSYRLQNRNTAEMVAEAEKRMYEAKAKYYQLKETDHRLDLQALPVSFSHTGLTEYDALLSVVSQRYQGIFLVSLDTDTARAIVTPEYLPQDDTEQSFSKLFIKYVHELIISDYHRALLNFTHYDALKTQLAEYGSVKTTYQKISGGSVVLGIYQVPQQDQNTTETLWVFENK